MKAAFITISILIVLSILLFLWPILAAVSFVVGVGGLIYYEVRRHLQQQKLEQGHKDNSSN